MCARAKRDLDRLAILPLAIDHPTAASAKPLERTMRRPFPRQGREKVDEKVSICIRLVALEQHFRRRRRIAEIRVDLLRAADLRPERVGKPFLEKKVQCRKRLVAFASAGAAAGAAVVTVVSNKTVEAKAHDMTAGKHVNVIADNHDELFQLAVRAGISGSGAAVQLGADIQVLKSTARAIVASDVTARTGNFNLQSSNDTNLTNVSGAAAGSGGSSSGCSLGGSCVSSGRSSARAFSGCTCAVCV